MANHSGIADSGERLQVIPATRKVMVPSTCKVIGTVGEHNAEQLTFQCPVSIDGHDVLNCTEHYIVYKNANGTVRKVDVEPIQLEKEPNTMVFVWTISATVTKTAGLVVFNVFFEDKDEDGSVRYRFGTTDCSDLEVLPNLASTVDDSDDYDDDFDWDEDEHEPVKVIPKVVDVVLLASAWEGVESPYSQVVTLDGVTKYSKIDLLPSVEQLTIFHDKDLAFVTENDDGIITVYAIGDKPTKDYTIQASITEVAV